MSEKWNILVYWYGRECGGFQQVYSIGYHKKDSTFWRAEVTVFYVGDSDAIAPPICSRFVDFGDSFGEILETVEADDAHWFKMTEAHENEKS